MLRILNLEAGYGPLRVLKGVSLHVAAGEVVAIIGANGAGKTTLLKAIAGILRPQAGSIFFDGKEMGWAAAERIVARGCALVPEGRHVFGGMSVRENLFLGSYACRRRGDGAAGAVRKFEEVCDLFPVLRERLGQPAGTLSGGQQQMLAIARALMSRPRLLMMDEPSLGVAPLVVRDLYATIARLKREGMTILLVEQNARAALNLADRAYVIESGRVVLEGDAARVNADEQVRSVYLGKAGGQ